MSEFSEQSTKEGFTELANSHRDQVYREMLRMCGNREDAEDVLTDALLAAYRRIETLKEREAFGAWLTAIARRMCFHLRSREKIRGALSLTELGEQGMELAEDEAKGPHEQMVASELRSAVKRTIEALPEEFREVYVMRDMEEMSGEETAERLGISVAAMKSRLHRARKIVREGMDAVLFHKEEL